MRRLIPMLTLLLLLAACGGAPANALPTPARTGEAVATQVPAASSNPAPTGTSEVPAALAPVATQSPAPTGTGEVVATQVPAASPNPAPTGTGEVVATQVPAASPNPAPTGTAEPVATQIPTASPNPAAATDSPLLLFLRGGALWAHALADGAERKLADDVREFALSTDRTTLALVRGGKQTDIWLLSLREAGASRQLTNDPRSESGLGWSPFGSLVFASSAVPLPPRRDQARWSAWCAQSEVRIIEEETPNARAIGPGCDPAFSPDGKRIAFAAPPSAPQAGFGAEPRTVNAIRLVNAAGKNGWDFAKATGGDGGLLVHGPAWSPDGAQLSYHRFAGYQALVDIALSEVSGSFQGKGKPYAVGAGWQWPGQFAPDGARVAVTQYNYSDARGFGGYDEWSVSVNALGATSQVEMPGGPLTVQGRQITRLFRAQAAVWSPDGAQLAVVLPAKWRPDLPDNEPFGAEGPGEIWRWTPGSAPAERLVDNVDFGTPLLWVR